MKQLTKVLAALTLVILILVGTSCTKTNEVKAPPVPQKYLSVQVNDSSLSVIDNVKINDQDVLKSNNFPMVANIIGFIEPNVSDSAKISVYLSYVKGETIEFTDSYGNVRSTTFDATSDKGYVSIYSAVGLGTQAPKIILYHTYKTN